VNKEARVIETKWVKILVGVVLLGIGLGIALPVVNNYQDIVSLGLGWAWTWSVSEIIRLVIGGVLVLAGLGIGIQSLLRRSSR